MLGDFQCRGSPPLAREGLKLLQISYLSSGITPARAGRTGKEEVEKLLKKDHPRSRGKDLKLITKLGPNLGSPPLAREGPHRVISLKGNCRITPARAGRTFIKEIHCDMYRDHPRSRGKDIKRSRILQCFILIDPVISLLSPKASNKFPHRPMLCAALFRQFHTLL